MKAFQVTLVGDHLIPGNVGPELTRSNLLADGILIVSGDPSSVDVVLAADDLADAERRLIAAFGDADVVGGGIRPFHDWNGYVPSRRDRARIEQALANLAHAVTRCTDPDCEIHHPLSVEDEASALNALAWYEAGRREGALGPLGPYADIEGVCEDCGKELDDDDRASTAPTLCSSCEKQRSYDRASA